MNFKEANLLADLRAALRSPWDDAWPAPGLIGMDQPQRIEVYARLRVNVDVGADVEALLRECGLAPIALREISSRERFAILRRMLQVELVYGTPVRDASEAMERAKEFSSFFEPGSESWTNVDEAFGQGLETFQWEPLSGSTYDAGVVVADRKHIGVLWVEDED